MSPEAQEARENQYDSPSWMRMSEIESEQVDGITVEQRYDMETDFVIEQGGLDLKPRDKILDLASGHGPHARRLAQKTGATVVATELGANLVEEAKKAHEQKGAGLDVRYVQANYGDVKSALNPDDRFNAVTCVGGSFVYLDRHEDNVKALRDYFDLLEPGGKIVFQWREKPQSQESEEIREGAWSRTKKALMSVLPKRKLKSQHEEEGQLVKKDGKDGAGREIMFELSDSSAGDKFYYVRRKREEGEEEIIEGDLDNGYKDLPNPYPDLGRGNLQTVSYGRTYVDPEGNEENLPVDTLTCYMDTKAYPIMERMLTDVGFENVRMVPDEAGAPLSVDGKRRMFGIVAEKPL